DVIRHLTLHLVAVVAKLPDEIEFGLRVAFAFRERDLGTGNFHAERDEVTISREAEPVHFGGEVEIRERIAEIERFLELIVFIGPAVFPEFLIGEVAVAVIELRAGDIGAIELHIHRAVLAVGLGIRAVIAKDVIAADVVARLFHTEGKIVVFGEELAAGVGGHGGEGFLRGVIGCAAASTSATSTGRGVGGEEAGAAAGLSGGVAAGSGGGHAAGVDRINGDVGFFRDVDELDELGLIIHAGLRDAAREIKQRFLFGIASEQFGRVLDGVELAVDVEDVEFGLIGGEGVVVRGIARAEVIGEVRAFADVEFFDGGFEEVFVVGEVL